MKETDYLLGNEKIIDDLKMMPIFAPFNQGDLQTLLKPKPHASDNLVLTPKARNIWGQYPAECR